MTCMFCSLSVRQFTNGTHCVHTLNKMENSFTVRKHKVLKAKKHKTRENSPDQKEKVLKKQRLLQNNESIKKCKAA